MSNNVLNVGIVGYGIVGQRRRHFIDRHPALKTTAICDVRFLKDGTMALSEIGETIYDKFEIEAKHGDIKGTDKAGVKYYNNYNTLLEHSDLDVLFVSVPNYLAPEVTIKGLDCGFHVFCEKPPGRTVDDIKNVINAEARNPRLKLKYGFNHRYHGSIKQVKAMLDNNTYGEIINMRGVYGKSSIVPFTGQWRSQKKYAGGGILLDQGIHMLDMFRYFCGDFEEVKSFVSNQYWGHDVEDNAYSIMRDQKGRVAMIHSSATQWQHSFRLEIALEEAALELSGILSGSKSYGRETLIVTPKQENSAAGSLSSQTTEFLEDNSWRDEINDFANSIVNDTQVLQGSSQDALKIMQLVHAVYSDDTKWGES